VRAALLVLVASAVLLGGCDPVSVVTAEPSTSRTPALTVPDVTGKRLNEARAVLGGSGLKNVKTVDATGKGRVVIDANNWIVRHQSPAEGTKVAVGDEITLDVAKPTDGIGPAGVTKGVMPDVVCMDLQAAQDTLQSADFFLLASKDAIGDRHQILDRDWVVIGQTPAAGTHGFPTTRVTLTVVKYGEPTGDSGCHS
jgi:beta-lactam-binding protein with PASTA domain